MNIIRQGKHFINAARRLFPPHFWQDFPQNPGCATISVSLKTAKRKTNNTKTLKCKVKVKPAQTTPDKPDIPDTPDTPDTVTGGATVEVTNSLPGQGYENTVLVSENAAVKVHYADENGKPLQGVTLMMTITRNTGSGAYEVKGNPSVVTDANGNATFSVGNKSNVTFNDTGEAANYDYTIINVADAKEVKTGNLKFAALYIDNIVKADSTKKVLSSNIDENRSGVANTEAIRDGENQGTAQEQYVYSQQVSLDGGSEHAVTFKGGLPKIRVAGENARAVYGEQNVGQSVSVYHTYEPKSGDAVKIAKLDADPSKLEYATLRFKNIKISEETRMVVTAHKSEEDAKLDQGELYIGGSVEDGRKVIIDGKTIKDDRGVQIALNRTGVHEMWFRVAIVSKGQVNTATRSYEWDKIEYMYRANVGQDDKVYDGATVKWETAPKLMSEERDITNEDSILKALMHVKANNRVQLIPGEPSGDKVVAKVTYSVPAFPRTGNAVITTYDKNGSVIDYYAYPAVNKSLVGTPIDKNIRKGANENVLAFKSINLSNDTDGLKDGYTSYDLDYVCYLISEDEAEKSVGEITAQDGSSVTVNATKTGSTLLKGTLMVGDKPIQEVLGKYGYDDSDATVYTSVQWNPIALATEDAGYIALKGQNIVITAQLVDKNENPVAAKDQEITFKNKVGSLPRVQGSRIETYKVGDTPVNYNKIATVVTNERYTDANGQVKLVLNSGEVATLEGICADAVSNKQYGVRLYVNSAGTKSEKVDLYWVDADIRFDESAMNSNYVVTSAANPVKSTADAAITLQSHAGERWEYGVQIVSDKLIGGIWNGKSVEINGLITDMRKNVDSVGDEVKQLDNQNRVEVYSTRSGVVNIVSSIQNKKFNNVIFKVGDDEQPNAGDPLTATTISKELTIKIGWQNAGQQIHFVNAASESETGGNYATNNRTAAEAPVYIRIRDGYGNNLNGQLVKVKVENGTIASRSFDNGNVATTPGAIVTNPVEAEGLLTSTNGNSDLVGSQEGLIKLYVNGINGFDYTTVTATDVATNESVAYTITWTPIASTPFDLNTGILGGSSIYASRYEGAGKILLTFNQNIVENSVQDGCFKVFYDDGNGKGEVEYKVNAPVVQNGNQIELTVPELANKGIGRKENIIVKYDKANNIGGVTYRLTSVSGERLGTDDLSIFDTYVIKVSQDNPPATSEELQ